MITNIEYTKDNGFKITHDDNDSVANDEIFIIGMAVYNDTVVDKIRLTSCKYSTFKDKSNLFFNYNNGYYYYLVGDQTKFNYINPLIKKEYCFPYQTIEKNYAAQKNLNNFKKTTIKQKAIRSAQKDFFKYTFGIEYETSCGVIPEEKCYQYGLIPLRDGSIKGNEYATIVMNNRNGFQLIKEQVNVLKKYTKFDNDCALHIHFGGFPLEPLYIFTVYRIFYKIQNELENYLPMYTFYTDRYKSTGKNYCAKLLDLCSVEQMYGFLATGMLDKKIVPLNMKASHPMDVDGNHKWQIKTRYYCVNFINALFYKRNKTIEFRFLHPTKNYNIIINWLYILNAILLKAECIYDIYKNEKDIIDYISHNINLINIIEIYNHSVQGVLHNFLYLTERIVNLQSKANDFIGKYYIFDDMIRRNALNI